MKRIAVPMLFLLIVGGPLRAQVSPSAQAGAATQSQAGASAQSRNAGAQGAGSASAQTNASASAAQSGVTISEGTTLNAALQGTLDARKNKPGDRVEARTTQDVRQDDKAVLPRGTRLIGRITEVQARGAGQSRSVLGIVFDTAEYRSGRVPLKLEIQALAASQASALASADDGGALMAGGGTLGAVTGAAGNLAGGIGSTAGAAAGSTVNTTVQSAGALGGLNATGVLASNSRGVFGLEGLSLDSAASGQGSMIVSRTGDVHLASGTQMLLRAGPQTQ